MRKVDGWQTLATKLKFNEFLAALAEGGVQAVGVALPPLFRRLDTEKPAAPTGPPQPRNLASAFHTGKRSAPPAAKKTNPQIRSISSKTPVLKLSQADRRGH